MNPTELFDQCCSDIEAAYARLGHRFGWRFLTCPRSTFITNPKVLLVTLQPAGDRDWFPELPRHSQERGSAYVVENWGRGVGRDPLQQQVQMFFDALASRTGVRSGRQLLAESLSSHIIPFRAPRLKDTTNMRETLAFSNGLWTKILGVIRPSLIVVLDKNAFKIFSVILEDSLRQSPRINEMRTGWGKYVARIRDFSAGPTLCWFPHWSTYKIFSSAACAAPVGKVIDVLAEKLH